MILNHLEVCWGEARVYLADSFVSQQSLIQLRVILKVVEAGVQIFFVIVETGEFKSSNQVIIFSQDAKDQISKCTSVLPKKSLLRQNLGQRILRQYNFQVLSSGKTVYIVSRCLVEILSHHASRLGSIPNYFELIVNYSLHFLKV